MINIHVNPSKFTRILVAIFLVLLVAHLSAVLMKYRLMPESSLAEKADQFFDFDREGNFPTYFNTILLFLSAQTFLWIAFASTSVKLYFKSYWYVLSFVFLFLSIDEFSRIHEGFNYYMPTLFGLGGTGILKFAWIIPYGILAIAFGLYSLKFLMSLEKKYLFGYIVCGALYLLGAVGFESIEGIIFERNNDTVTFEYIFYLLTVEESLEMLALILLLNYNLNFLVKINTTK